MTLGTDVFLCASKTCRLCELMQRGKDQEGNAVKVLGLFFWGGLVGCGFFFFWMMKEMEVWGLTGFAEGYEAGLQRRANICSALHCLPCCYPFCKRQPWSPAHQRLKKTGSPSTGKVCVDHSCRSINPLPVSAIARFQSTSYVCLEPLEPGTSTAPGG